MSTRTAVRDRITLLSNLKRVGGWPLTALLVANALAGLMPPIIAIAVGQVIAGLETADIGPSTQGLIPLILGLAIEQVALTIREIYSNKIALEIDGTVRARVRELCIDSRDIARFDDETYIRHVTGASERFSGPRPRSAGLAATAQLQVFSQFMAALLSALVIFRASWALAIGVAVATLIIRFINVRRSLRVARTSDSGQDQLRYAKYWGDLATDSAAAREVRMFGLHEWIVENRSNAVLRWASDFWVQRRQMLTRQWHVMGIAFLAGCLLFIVPAHQVMNGTLDLSSLMSTVTASFSVFQLSNTGREVINITWGLEVVESLTALEQLDQEGREILHSAAEYGPLQSNLVVPIIELDNISFTYPAATEPTLCNLSLRIEPGETVAVVGENGAGKTTLLKLLSGIYHPTSGSILIDGDPVTESTVAEWWQRISVAFQDPVRYPLSAEDNLLLGTADRSYGQAQMEEALAAAGAEKVVASLPDGLNTLLSAQFSRGQEVSGGQWQRLAIARALLAIRRKRGLLLLDEPTAHLDANAEVDFFDRIRSAAGDATVLLISHRLSNVKNADRIIVFQGGAIIEQGKHAHLMALDGAYAKMFRAQASRFTDEPSR
ncbi:ABC transporter ATP-binding protein [Streptomyces sp. NPDC051658]|uniref:ABC transporter ATP-binding protein n=1 Tax=Streptomyces sp. NPDC051658 TaxID=3365667 RepID=UPI0037A9F86E